MNYLDKIDPFIRDYYGILSEEFPEFLLEYVETPRMQNKIVLAVLVEHIIQRCVMSNYGILV